MTFKRPGKLAIHRWRGGTSGGKFLPKAAKGDNTLRRRLKCGALTPTAAERITSLPLVFHS